MVPRYSPYLLKAGIIIKKIPKTKLPEILEISLIKYP